MLLRVGATVLGGAALCGRMCQVFGELFFRQIENHRIYVNQSLEKEQSSFPAEMEVEWKTQNKS